MSLPAPRVLLFGAGATRAGFPQAQIQPPLDSDFFDIATQISGRGTPGLVRKVVKDVFALYGRVNGIGLEQYYRDIETREELGVFAKTENRPKDYELRKKNIEELVRRVVVHTTTDFSTQPAKPIISAVHQKILGHIKGGDTLITFNYDTVIEESMPKNMPWSPKDGYGIDASGLTHDWAKAWIKNHSAHAKSNITLLKLHGSVNWVLYNNSKVRLKPRPYVIRQHKKGPTFDKAAILPPGWHKRVDRNPFKTLWREARLRLEKCKSLVIIGYSLPETDLIARALFAEVSRMKASRSNWLRELHVADNSEMVKNRLIDLFVPALGSKGRVIRYKDAQNLAEIWGTGVNK